ARQSRSVDHSEHDAGEHDEHFSGSNYPEPLIRKPTEQRRSLRVVNDDAGHRKSAQEVDLEVPGACEVRPPTAGHARGKGKTGARWKSTSSALWPMTPRLPTTLAHRRRTA